MYILKAFKSFISELYFQNKNLILVSAIYLALAFAAFIKDATFAMYLGTTQISDIFYFAAFIPDAVGFATFFTALSTASIPLFIKIKKDQSIEVLQKTVHKLSIIYFLSCVLITSIFIIFFTISVNVFNISLNNSDFSRLLIITLPTIVIFPALAFFTAYHQVLSNYIRASLGPVILNFVLILFPTICIIFKIPENKGVYILCLGTYISLLVMFIFLNPTKNFKEFFYKLFFTKEIQQSVKPFKGNTLGYILNQSTIFIKVTYFSFLLNVLNKETFKFSKLAFLYQLPLFVVILLNQAVLFIERQTALSFVPGSLSAINYSYRLSQFPVWVFAAAVSMTTLAEILSKDTIKDEYISLKSSLIKVLGISIPVAIFFFIFKDIIISILFKRGSFDETSLNLTVSIFSYYVFAIPFLSVNSILTKYFTAKGQLKKILPSYALIMIVWILADTIIVPVVGLYFIGINATLASMFLMLLLVKNVKNKSVLT